MAAMRIRAAIEADLAVLAQVERAAGRMFRDIGMPEIADDEPPSPQVLAGYLAAGRAWVAVDDADRPVAYLIAEPVDGNLHIEQVSVHPDAAGRGVGRRLIEHLARHAKAGDVPALTLTTFADVPWNAPYYRRLGFAVVPADEQGPELRRVREHEAAIGLDRWPRVAMARPVGPDGRPGR